MTVETLRSWTIRTVAALFLVNTLAFATDFTFNTDPFAGTPVLGAPGRQIVGGELFINFNTTTDRFVFDRQALGLGSTVQFANGPVGSLPASLNIAVLQTLDNDANPLTPFGAGNAADLIASRVTQHGPGVFIYFNQSLDIPRLVYSHDLADNTADLRILARMINLNGALGVNALSRFSEANFEIVDSAATGAPEPSAIFTATGGVTLLVLCAACRNRRRKTTTNQWEMPG